MGAYRRDAHAVIFSDCLEKSYDGAGEDRSIGDVHPKVTKANHPRSRAVHAHAGHVKGQPLKVQLPPCLASPENSPVASISQPMSITKAFTGATVLVTGGTGYLGSLVIEQLLRVVPNVRRIYVIIRSKRGMLAEARLNKLLERSMWHLHKDNSRIRLETAAKLTVIPGDLLLPNCGVSGPNRRRLAREVDYVIHCAASICFEEHIHTLLANNYLATRNVADLAAAAGKLRAFVHLSTAYVNCDRPHGSHVEETLYPFDLSACRPKGSCAGSSMDEDSSCSSSWSDSNSEGGHGNGNSHWGLSQSWLGVGSNWSIRDLLGISYWGSRDRTDEVSEKSSLMMEKRGANPWSCVGDPEGGTLDDVEALVAELMALSPETATKRVAEYLRATNMPNAYFFTKRMAEVLISARHTAEFPVAIVRPSLVGCTARSPHPGYFGNNAGPTSIALAFALGIATFTSHKADSVFDVIPGDICSSIILASAAAASQKESQGVAPMVVHACSSTTNPETLYGWWNIGYRYWSPSPPPVRLTLGDYPSMDCRRPPVGIPDDSLIFKVCTAMAQAKFWVISSALRLAGYSTLSSKLWSGWQAWRTYNRSALDFNLFFCSAMSQRLERHLPACERSTFPLTWRAGEDAWAPYLRSHFDQIRHHHFQQPGYAPALEG